MTLGFEFLLKTKMKLHNKGEPPFQGGKQALKSLKSSMLNLFYCLICYQKERREIQTFLKENREDVK